MFREEVTPILQSLLQKKEKEGTLSNLFYAANSTLIPNQTKYEEKKYRPIIFYEYRYKSS